MMVCRTTQADALHAAGEWEKAAGLFADAERRQQEREPQYPLVYRCKGIGTATCCCRRDGPPRRATGRREPWKSRAETIWILDIALDTLTLGRAHLALALQSLASGLRPKSARDDARAAAARLDEAVEGLRASGQNDYVPRGLLARAAFRRAIGDWDGAARDLDEVAGDRRAGADAALISAIARSNARGSRSRGARPSRR